METPRQFCTCTATHCKWHPSNHDQGCDLCIRKNLNAGEIPGCFFHLVSDDLSTLKEFTVESFVHFYLETKEKKEAVQCNNAAENKEP